MSPDYSYTVAVKENQFSKKEGDGQEEQPAEQPVDISLKIRAPFVPETIDTEGIKLTKEYEEIVKIYSEHVHDYWCYNKFEQGWSYGEIYNDANMAHPMLKPYDQLSRKEQVKYEDLTRDVLKAIKSLGWAMEKTGGISSKNTARLIQKKLPDGVNTNGYVPKPFDLSNTTITKEIEDLSATLAVNCHNIWAKRKMLDLESIGAELHHLVVHWELLTDKDKQGHMLFTIELMKVLQLNGVRVVE